MGARRLSAIAIGWIVGSALGQVAVDQPAWTPAEANYKAVLRIGADVDPATPTPASLLGFEIGDRPATHAQVESCLKAWDASDRLALVEYARSYENRALYYAVITSPNNHQRLADLKANLNHLANPAGLSEAEINRLVDETPAVAWLAYSIHGDEMSSTDAALALAYNLVTARGPEVSALLDELIIIIDPLMNPDGRDRFIHQLDQAAGRTPCLDSSALQHTGRWPYGRGNHYLFDLNRDWAWGANPETRGRQRAIASWRPQLMIDSHEMGPDDTYLFNPPRDPINPHVSPQVRKWWDIFANEQGAAFDARGWSYYTREWLDFWYPGYSDAWSVYHGAIGILYEQARVGGKPLRKATGEILTYHEAVEHQFTSSLTNLRSLKMHRKEVLADYVRQKQAGLNAQGPAMFILPPSENTTRQRELIDSLRNQGIEVTKAAAAFSASGVTDTLGVRSERRDFPAGAYLVARRQPMASLVGALLDFDPRMTEEFLNRERRELETTGESLIYDVTGWSLPLAFGLEAFWADSCDAKTTPLEDLTPPKGEVTPLNDPPHEPYAYLVRAGDDGARRTLAHLLQDGVHVRVATEDFRAGGASASRGSWLIRRHENKPQDDLLRRLGASAAAGGVRIEPLLTGRSMDEGPDLGGSRFSLLTPPRVALFGGAGVDFTCYGSIWRLLDQELGLAVSLLDLGEHSASDLRGYNVIILPNTDGAAATVYGSLFERLKPWVESGGTLIAIGSAAAALADAERGLSAVRRRGDVLTELGSYAVATARDRASGAEVNPRDVWETAVEPAPTTEPAAIEDESDEELDEYRAKFSPVGAIVRAEVDDKHWLTSGLSAEAPVFVAGASVLLAKPPVSTPVRLAPGERLRLSGLLWPEAVARLANSAYVTVEQVENGQVILFAQDPAFRGFWRGTQGLLVNAILLGPGCGTTPAPLTQ